MWRDVEGKLPESYCHYVDSQDLEKLIGVKERFSFDEFDGEASEETRQLDLQTKEQFLVPYNKSRWYSAFVVMKHVFSLFPCLEAMKMDLELGDGASREEWRNGFLHAMSGIDRFALEKTLHLLLPLVQAIVYCQQETSAPIDVTAVIASLQSFFLSADFVSLDATVKKECFEERMDCSVGIPRPIYDFFRIDCCEKWKDRLAEDNPEIQAFAASVQQAVKEHILSQQRGVFFVERKESELVSMADAANAEIMRFLLNYKEREGLPMRVYLDQAAWKYPILYEVYKDLFCDVVTSSVVERSFANCGVVSVKKSYRRDMNTANTAAVLKTNYQCLKDYHLFEELMPFLGVPSRKRSEPSLGHMYQL